MMSYLSWNTFLTKAELFYNTLGFRLSHPLLKTGALFHCLWESVKDEENVSNMVCSLLLDEPTSGKNLETNPGISQPQTLQVGSTFPDTPRSAYLSKATPWPMGCPGPAQRSLSAVGEWTSWAAKPICMESSWPVRTKESLDIESATRSP